MRFSLALVSASLATTSISADSGAPCRNTTGDVIENISGDAGHSHRLLGGDSSDGHSHAPGPGDDVIWHVASATCKSTGWETLEDGYTASDVNTNIRSFSDGSFTATLDAVIFRDGVAVGRNNTINGHLMQGPACNNHGEIYEDTENGRDVHLLGNTSNTGGIKAMTCIPVPGFDGDIHGGTMVLRGAPNGGEYGNKVLCCALNWVLEDIPGSGQVDCPGGPDDHSCHEHGDHGMAMDGDDAAEKKSDPIKLTDTIVLVPVLGLFGSVGIFFLIKGLKEEVDKKSHGDKHRERTGTFVNREKMKMVEQRNSIGLLELVSVPVNGADTKI